MYIRIMKEMFSRMVEQKQASLIPEYYHKDFLLYTNGQKMNYQHFLDSHIKYYKTPIRYKVEYDEETLVEGKDQIAARVWITTKMPDEEPKEIEVIVIATFKDKKFYRVWELTYPDWSNLEAFKK